jgi:hypothetical protein
MTTNIILATSNGVTAMVIEGDVIKVHVSRYIVATVFILAVVLLYVFLGRRKSN